MTSYYSVNKIYNFNEKQKAHIVELIWSIVLVIGSTKSFFDIYYDNSILDTGHTFLVIFY